jgi:outer membrane protein OmpA-like peptidoglycan-associated protein
MTPTIDRPRHARWTWSIAVLLVLLLAAMWLAGYGPGGACCGPADANDAAPVPAAIAPQAAQGVTKKPGTFAVRIDAGRHVLEGAVSDAATKSRVLHAAAASYGEPNVVDRLTVDAETDNSPCVKKADALLAALNSEPPIGIDCDAQGGVTLTGSAGSEADKTARERWARDFFGTDVSVADAIEIAPSPPVTRPEDVHCAARMPAAVTFATGSSRIDARGRKLLDAILPCLREGRFEIAGHTDNIGTAEDNLRLSRARAESVRAYMILKGVDPERLVAVGYGIEHPAGDNATREGRARNRRIEFVRR